MKYLSLFALIISIGVGASTAMEASSVPSENGLQHGSGLSTDQVNPSPNPAPTTEADVIENSTLTNRPVETGPYQDGQNIPGENEIEAQEDAMDYSTTPEERPSNKPNPNKIGN